MDALEAEVRKIWGDALVWGDAKLSRLCLEGYDINEFQICCVVDDAEHYNLVKEDINHLLLSKFPMVEIGISAALFLPCYLY